MKTNGLLIALLCITAVLATTSCHDKKSQEELKKEKKPTMLTAEGYVVTPQQFQSGYLASGTLRPNEEIQILPEVSGRITSISFNEGSHVEQGQALVKLYNDDIRATIQKLEAQKQLQLKIKDRQAELLRIGGISQQDFETTTTQIQSIDADVAYAQAQLRKTTIFAPFSGRIGIRNVSVGAVITPATIIATLQQTRILKMDFTLPDQYKSQVPQGKKLTFTVTGLLDTFDATISAIEPAADAETHTIKVRALVQNDDHKLVAGSFTHVILPFENNSNALLIPSQSVIPTDRDKKVAVIINGKANLVTVTTGTRTKDKVEILQGLKPGDTIITTGIMQVKQDMAVKVTRINAPTR